MIKSVLGGRVSVYLYDDGQDVDIPTTFLTHVPPMKGDKVMGEEDGEERVLDLFSLSLSSPSLQVKCIRGAHAGNAGVLMNIDEGDGIVKLDSDGSLKIITLNELAKLVLRT